ncbi:MAG: hypothetical protein Tsb0020_26200 [Haliangiales bacterium]
MSVQIILGGLSRPRSSRCRRSGCGRPTLAAIERDLPAAMSGDSTSRTQLVTSIGELIRINREAMRGRPTPRRRNQKRGAAVAAPRLTQ